MPLFSPGWTGFALFYIYGVITVSFCPKMNVYKFLTFEKLKKDDIRLQKLSLKSRIVDYC